MSDNQKNAVLTILPGLQYLAQEARSGGAGPVSGWIAETIERIVAWADTGPTTQSGTAPLAQGAMPITVGYGVPDCLDTAISLKAALTYLLVDAREAHLSETTQLLQRTVATLEGEMQRMARLN